MKNYLRLIFITLFLYLASSIFTTEIKSHHKSKKNILVNIFPGGRSHNFVVKELFDYSLRNSKEIEYVYHILVHNTDKSAWPVDGPYKIYGYGDINFYEKEFMHALELVTKHPVFGFSRFNKAIMHAYVEFIKSGLIEELKGIKFDLLITDIPNFVSSFAKEYYNIENHMYLSPPSIPNIFFNLFELNSSILPAMGSYYFDVMSFSERFMNFIFVNGMKVMYKTFMDDHVKVFKEHGYELKYKSAYLMESFFMIQYPVGYFFNSAFPPNIIRLNAITPKPSKSITDTKLNNFLNIYKKNIYFSQGTIVKIVNFEQILGIFHHFNEYGFILSFNTKLISKELLDQLPQNVLLIPWVNQNDLLGDDRLHAFITHGGTNSVSEALYHNKPMVILGVTLDQINTAAVANKRKVAVVYHKVEEITLDNLIYGLEQILKPEEDNIYLQNAKKIGKLIRANKDPREEYAYWIDYIFRMGYKHLLVKSYTELNPFQLNNYDVFAVMVLILFLISFVIKKILFCMFCSCKAHKKKDKKY